MTNTTKITERIIKLPEVIDRTGLSRSSIYAKIDKEEFPSSISLGARSVGWLENDISLWINDQIEKTRS